MSRKRSSKEKSLAEEQTVVEDQSHVLVSARAQLTSTNNFTLYTDRYRQLSAVAIAPPDAPAPHFSAPQLQWWRQVASAWPSPLLYPYHTVSIRANPAVLLPPNQCDGVAIAILSTLDVHRAACTWATDTQEMLSSTATAVEQLIGHCVTASGHCGPEDERKDETFTSTASAGRRDEDGRPTEASLTVTGHYHSTHINVCCGQYYYKLEVLDSLHATTRSRTDLSADLAAIVSDAQEREAGALYHRNISPEAAEDIRGMYQLLARVSAIDDASAADVYRRLQHEGEVNMYTLSMLRSALFTVVLEAPVAAEERATQTQWLHSGMSLYFDTEQRGALTLRVHGTLVEATTARRVAEHIAGRLAQFGPLPPFVNPLHARGGAGSSRRAVQSSTAGTAHTAGQCARRVGTGAEALEMWLPEKHRVALRPYVGMASGPRWVRCCLPSASGTMAHLLLSLLVACESALFDRGTPRRPRVCLVAQNPSTKVPGAVPLYTEATEAFIQYTRAPEARSLPQTYQWLRDAALASIHERLAVARTLETATDEGSSDDVAFQDLPDMDVCVTAQLLSRVQYNATSMHHVQQCLSFLGAPARLFVNCTVQQTCVQKVPSLGDGQAVAVDAGHMCGEEVFTEAVCTRVESNLRTLSVQDACQYE